MEFIEAIILGLVQGLTEFLPISSSAHLLILSKLMGHDAGATFTAISQLGTEAAVIIYFRKDIARIIGRWFRHFTSTGSARRGTSRKGRHKDAIPKDDPDVRMGWLIIIGTIPIVIVGYLAQDLIDTTLRSLWITAVVLIVFGIILGLADLLGRKTKTIETLTYRDGVFIGLAQMLALIPGVSRSGATMTMGRALGYERPAIARYGFLLAIPAVFGSGLYKLAKSFSEPRGAYGYPETLLATVVAFAVGYAVIAFLMRYIQTRSFLPFVIYRILLGAALVVVLSLGILTP